MRLSIALPCLLSVLPLPTVNADQWTDRTGKHQIEATFVRMTDNAVVLRRADGVEVTVPLTKLNEDGRRLAGERAGETERASGEPAFAPILTLADINNRARGSVRPEANAVVALCNAIGVEAIQGSDEVRRKYVDALGGHVVPTDAPFLSWRDFAKSEDRDFGHAVNPMQATDLRAVRTWLERNNQPLDAAVLAFRQSEFFDPAVAESEDDLLCEALMPLMLAGRDVLYGLLARSQMRLEQGFVEAALDDALAGMRWSRLVSREPALVGVYVSQACESMCFDRFCAITYSTRFDQFVAEDAHKQLAQLPARQNFAESLHFEKAFVMDALAHIADGGPQALLHFIVLFVGGNHPEAVAWAKTPEGRRGVDAAAKKWSEPDRELWLQAAAVIGGWYDNYAIEIKATPVGERHAVVQRIAEAIKVAYNDAPRRVLPSGAITPESLPSVRKFVLEGKLPAGLTATDLANFMQALTFPDITHAAKQDARSALRETAFPAIVALGAYHSKNYTYPVKLENLIPEYLSAVPADVVFGQPFIYARDGNGYRLYSAGPDGIDDGGNFENSADSDDFGIVRLPLR
jgi:hypothetical protein